MTVYVNIIIKELNIPGRTDMPNALVTLAWRMAHAADAAHSNGKRVTVTASEYAALSDLVFAVGSSDSTTPYVASRALRIDDARVGNLPYTAIHLVIPSL